MLKLATVTMELLIVPAGRTSLTSAGTPAYMAPELLQERPFNKSVDVYAFGILLWEVRSCPEGWNEFACSRGVRSRKYENEIAKR